MRVVCVRHVPFEGPGTIEEWVALRGHELRDVLSSQGRLPDPRSIDLLVVLGGPMGVYDVVEHPWLDAERSFLAATIEANRLVLGVCLGAQMVADAVGGSVRRGSGPEIGWYPVRRTAAGADSGTFAGWPDEFVAGHWHGDTFDLPPAIESAFESDVTANQAFEACEGRAVGLQFHLEWTPVGLGALIDACGDELVPAPSVQSAAELLSDPGRFARSRELLFDLLDGMEARL